MEIKGRVVDIFNDVIYGGVLIIEAGKIVDIRRIENAPNRYIIPGLVDAHIHIESSMLTPGTFAQEAVRHGTVATVSDPHEIANVLGMEGVRFMIEDGERVPFKFYFGAPSCVPATSFETAGDHLGPQQIEELLKDHRILYLSEMMNYPGVIHKDPEVMAKISIAHRLNKPIDGHAPGLRDEEVREYIKAGISTDHECFTIEEALEKINLGMKIAIREGSAAKNFEALYPLIDLHPEMVMLCSDDKHPDDLLIGHINELLAKAVSKGCNIFNVLRSATLVPGKHYGLEVGLLRSGDSADITIVEDLKDFNVSATFIDGKKVYGNGNTLFEAPAVEKINRFNCNTKQSSDFKLNSYGKTTEVKVIKAIDGELITEMELHALNPYGGFLEADPERDILKMTVVNRYEDTAPSVSFIRGFGLTRGAIASSVAHDSHNIVAVGVDDDSLAMAVNEIIVNKGGVAVFDGEESFVLPLPIAGLMSDQSASDVGLAYQELDRKAKLLGSELKAPFMTLSFMALLVIPRLKLSDKGLFDSEVFNLVDLQN